MKVESGAKRRGAKPRKEVTNTDGADDTDTFPPPSLFLTAGLTRSLLEDYSGGFGAPMAGMLPFDASTLLSSLRLRARFRMTE